MITSLQQDPPSVYRWRTRMIKAARRTGVELAEQYQICLGREIAASLFKTEIASTETLKRAQDVIGASVFCFRQSGALTGFLALLPLRKQALGHLDSCSFDALDVDFDLVARPHEPAFALYLWGFAALTKAASAAVRGALNEIQNGVFAATPRYARVASAKGDWLLRNTMGFQSIEDDRSDYVRAPAQSQARVSA